MPTYDFRCNACGAEFSTFVSVKKRGSVICEHCDSGQIKQLLRGFYVQGTSGGGACAGTGCASCPSGCSA